MDYQMVSRVSGLEEAVQAIAQGTQHLDSDEQEQILMQVINGHTRLDIPYLRALYFPECSPAARIPTKFPVPTGLVTQKFSFYLNTGLTGSGFVGMCPQDTTYYPCFKSDTLQNSQAAASGFGNKIFFVGESSNYLPQNFSHARLVGASMQISWIGQADQEAGFLCSSHIFDSAPVCLSETIIEEGFYPVRAQPSKGIRLCYIPKDDEDAEFAQLNYQLSWFKGSSSITDELQCPYDVTNWFDGPPQLGATNPAIGNSFINDGNADLQPLTLEINDPKVDKTIAWNPLPPSSTRAPQAYYGLHKHKGSFGYPNMMICYWKGLPISKDWLRVDVVRHFEVLPRQQVKDLISVGRTKPSPETLDKVSNSSSEMSHIHNSTIEDVLPTWMQNVGYKVVNGEAFTPEGQPMKIGPRRPIGHHPVTQSSLGGLRQGRDNTILNATVSGLKIASSIFDFLPNAWLDKPLLSILRKGVNYGLERIGSEGAVQGGGGTFGLSQGTPSYTRVVLQ